MSTEAELVARVQRSDDRRAFAELVRLHQSGVRALLRRLTCGDLALADDLAQETFLQAYLKLPGFRHEARLATWLFRIAYNLYLGSRRRRSSAPVAALSDEAKGDEAANAGPALFGLDLSRALGTLAEAERAAVVLCALAGLTHEEAARVLDCPVGTLKSHVLRGKERLRARLSAWKERASDEHATGT